MYSFVVEKFLEQERNSGLTKAALARRLGKSPDRISRLLGAPGNWTIETVSELLLGIAGEELIPHSKPVEGRTPVNIDQHRLFVADASAPPVKQYLVESSSNSVDSGFINLRDVANSKPIQADK